MSEPEEPTLPAWYDSLIDYMAKRERTAELRKRLQAARAAGLARRHAERLRRRRENTRVPP